jgi:hypothetical protein
MLHAMLSSADYFHFATPRHFFRQRWLRMLIDFAAMKEALLPDANFQVAIFSPADDARFSPRFAAAFSRRIYALQFIFRISDTPFYFHYAATGFHVLDFSFIIHDSYSRCQH